MRSAILQQMTKGKWSEHILTFMNMRAPFDLSGVDFTIPIGMVRDHDVAERRRIFYKYQMEILRKTAEPMEIHSDLPDESAIMLYPSDEFSLVTWRSEEDLDNEFYPHQIAQAIRLTKDAARRHAAFIPAMQGLFLIKDRLALQVTSQKHSLRKVLAQRGVMASRGPRIVQQLLLLYAELKDAKAVARTLAPETIYVDAECERMALTDVSALVFHHEPVYYIPVAKMPYNHSELDVHPLTKLTSPGWDLWSVAVMILEVVAGSDLVLLLRTYEDVVALMADVRHLLSKALHNLLEEVLFRGQDSSAIHNAKSDDFAELFRIEDAVNAIEDAKSGHEVLKQRAEHFLKYAERHGAQLAE